MLEPNLDKTTKNVTNVESNLQKKGSAMTLIDNRPKSTLLNKQKEIVQKKQNNTGLPDNLKSGIENLSGHSMDDVKVHYNSDKPAQLNAHAYAQGNQIHVASGQEKYVPHEAWHVVQQKQGRVKPTMQMKGKVNVNDDAGLENEADVMGAKALQMKSTSKPTYQFARGTSLEFGQVDQPVIQRKVGFEFQTRIVVKDKEGEDLPYQSKIFTTYPKDVEQTFDNSYFNLSSDYDSTMNSSVIEIVTPPADSREELETTMNKVDNIRSSIYSETDEGTKETTIENVVDKYKTKSSNAEDQFNIQKPEAKIGKEGSTWDEQSYTKAQFTFGAKLEYLAELLTRIMSNPKLVRDPDLLKDLKDHIKAVRYDINKRKDLFDASTETETGLAALTVMYKKGLELYSGDQPLKYPKAGTLFMARTDFHSMYQQLGERAQAHWDGFVDRQGGKDAKMFPNGFYLDDSKTESDQGPTYGDWLTSIKTPTDFSFEFADYSSFWEYMVEKVNTAKKNTKQIENAIATSGKEDGDKAKATRSLKRLKDKKLPREEDFVMLLEILEIPFNLEALSIKYAKIIKKIEKRSNKDLMSRGKVQNTASSMGSMEVPEEGSDQGMAIIENRFMAQPFNENRAARWKEIVLEMYDELQKAIKVSKVMSRTENPSDIDL